MMIKNAGFIIRKSPFSSKKLIFLLTICFLPSVWAAKDTTFTWGANSMHVGMSIPEKWKINNPAPGLIIWFHGGMRSQNPEKGVLAHKALLPLVDADQYFLVSPAAYRGHDWLNPRVIGDVIRLTNELIKKFRLDSNNIVLTGVSDGCVAVINYSIHTGRAIRTRLLFSSAPQLVIGENQLEKIAGQFTGTWHFFQGLKDRLFAPSQVMPMLYYWKKVVPGTTLHIYPEGQHDYTWFTAKDLELIKNLFRKPEVK